MLRVHPIRSLDLPELAPYRTLRQQADHYRDRRFVAEGTKVVERLLESDLHVVSVLLSAEALEVFRARLVARPECIEAFVGPKSLLETMTGFSLYQGVLACAQLPEPVELDRALALAARPRFVVALDGLSNAENLGSLIRNAAAFGAQAIVVGETCAPPYLRRSVRSSMGTLFRLAVVEPLSLPEALREMRRRGLHCVGAHPHTDRRSLPEAALRQDCCIVLGSEGHGLSPAVRAECDELVAVPMQNGVDSLNVGAAAAVFCYEVWRQRSQALVEAPAVQGSTR